MRKFTFSVVSLTNQIEGTSIPPKTRTQTSSCLVLCIGPTYFLLNFIAHAYMYTACKAVIMLVYIHLYSSELLID